MKKSKKTILWGMVLIITGLLFLGNNLELWNFNVFFEGWWTLFIIVPSVIELFNKENTMSSILGIMIGVLLLLAVRDCIAWPMVGKIFLPFLIISIGVSILVKPKFKIKMKKGENGKIECIGIFSGRDEKVSDKFNGADCVAVFGGIDLDLRSAEITEDITIDCVAVFGGINIKLPEDVIVKTEGISIFGAISNDYVCNSKKKKPTVHVNHVSIFGGTELK